ncbi:MAG TPA: hypothetical protein VKT28_02815 [Puia sp.]|nr:hypothetical protein [Puia sp.]
MKKNLLFALFLFNINFLLAQKNGRTKNAHEENSKYQFSREEITIPEYGLNRVEKLIKDSLHKDDFRSALDEKKYQSLSLRERFTYNMINPEAYAQNCSFMPLVPDAQKKIFAELPIVFEGFHFSKRQDDFFMANSDSVIEWMRYSIAKTKKVGMNYKRVIEYVNAKQLIPVLIEAYDADKKDHDILTVLMLLMDRNKYPAFLNSDLHKRLYDAKETPFKSYVDYTLLNEALIIKKAEDFYNGLSK